MTRSLAVALSLPLLSLLGCVDSIPETVSSGRVSQLVLTRSYGVTPRLDLIVVVGTSSQKDGAALRASVATAIRSRMRDLAEGNGYLRDLTNPVDVRAFVTSAADGTSRTPTDTPALLWHEADATTEGESAFSDAIERAILAATDGEPAPGGLVGAVARTLDVAATPADTLRLVVVAATADDTGPALVDRAEDAIFVVVPDARGGVGCAPAARPGLEAWTRSLYIDLTAPCSEPDLLRGSTDYPTACLPRPLAPPTDGRPSCRVRAFVPRGTACDAARGWRPLAESAARSVDPELAGLDACEVVELVGDQGAACRDRATPWDGRASGWCVPGAALRCPGTFPRVVGAAAPPFARLEIACELAP